MTEPATTPSAELGSDPLERLMPSEPTATPVGGALIEV